MRGTVIMMVSVLLLGVAGFMANRYWFAPPVPTALPAVTPSQYVCPMHPDVVNSEPGTCPICGMALVAAQRNGAAGSEENDGLPAVRITPAVANNLNVRTAPVSRAKLAREARMQGHVQGYEPAGTLTIRTGMIGRVSALRVQTPGQQVMSGDVLLEVAPTDNPASAPIKILMPQDGEVVEVHAKVGDALAADAALVTIKTLGQAAVDVDVFQSEALWIRAGDRAELSLRHLPGRVWEGRVQAENIRTTFPGRTYSARLIFFVPEGVVLNDMYGAVRIFGAERPEALTVPREALIRTEDGERVVLATDDGFRPVPVTSGLESGGRVEILSGLKDSDQVVVSAQFLLDAESNLRAELQRMSTATAPPAHSGAK
ncbi:MAG: efflux RND transporter periplasmic adaptor subunit [Gammaproteobacteria bacterium]|nr:efflux RND transporter periplasmic adaptor subunit [Gammaproteobacteria bacterium]